MEIGWGRLDGGRGGVWVDVLWRSSGRGGRVGGERGRSRGGGRSSIRAPRGVRGVGRRLERRRIGGDAHAQTPSLLAFECTFKNGWVLKVNFARTQRARGPASKLRSANKSRSSAVWGDRGSAPHSFTPLGLLSSFDFPSLILSMLIATLHRKLFSTLLMCDFAMTRRDYDPLMIPL